MDSQMDRRIEVQSHVQKNSSNMEWKITGTNIRVEIADDGIVQIGAQFGLQHLSQETRHGAAQRRASGIGRQPEVGATSRNRTTNQGYDKSRWRSCKSYTFKSESK